MHRKNIYLVRHPEVYNPNKLCYGQSEMPLEENFTVAFDWIKDRLNLNTETVFYSSPLRRCAKLASYLSDGNFIADKRISDMNFGVWEMKEWREISAKELDVWQKDFVSYKVKTGECFSDIYARAIAFFEEILSNNDQESLVVITHSCVIRSIVSYVLDFPLENVYNLQIDCNSISKIVYSADSEISSVSFLNLTADQR